MSKFTNFHVFLIHAKEDGIFEKILGQIKAKVDDGPQDRYELKTGVNTIVLRTLFKRNKKLYPEDREKMSASGFSLFVQLIPDEEMTFVYVSGDFLGGQKEFLFKDISVPYEPYVLSDIDYDRDKVTDEDIINLIDARYQKEGEKPK